MNKRYMDFVPVNATRVVKKKPVVQKPQVTEVGDFEVNEIFEARETKPRAGVSTGGHEPNYGVIEDFQPKFVKTEVEKRPLSRQKTAKEEVAEAKAKKIEKMPVIGRKATIKKEASQGGEAAETSKEVKTEAEALKIPKKTPFVNTEKVPKRPLSKNVYQKKVAEPKEKVTGPVTIINKPEKDSRVGLVVTIIITIILGAAAGTVAFLLLPK